MASIVYHIEDDWVFVQFEIAHRKQKGLSREVRVKVYTDLLDKVVESDGGRTSIHPDFNPSHTIGVVSGNSKH